MNTMGNLDSWTVCNQKVFCKPVLVLVQSTPRSWLTGVFITGKSRFPNVFTTRELRLPSVFTTGELRPGAYPGGMHRMHVHPPLPPMCIPPSPMCIPPPCASPLPSLKGYEGGGVGQPKMCIPPGKILGTPLVETPWCIHHWGGGSHFGHLELFTNIKKQRQSLKYTKKSTPWCIHH